MAKKATTQAKSQPARFVEKARELGCDEDEAAFEKRLKVVAASKSAPKATRNRADSKK